MELITLASASPQRQRLLREAGYDFVVVEPAGAEPDPAAFTDAAAYVTHTAWSKARQVAPRVCSGLVLAADTVVALDGQIIGKAKDVAHAKAILDKLCGTEHEVLTGLCLWRRPDDFWLGAFDRTRLRMRRLSSAELDQYVAGKGWVGKAGAYAIQDPDPYVSIVAGSHSNVVGLPLELLRRLLAQLPVHGSGR